VEVPEVMGRAIDIRAAGDIAGVGLVMRARDDISVTAGGTIDFSALQLDYFKETKGWSVGFTYPGSALIKGLESGGPKGLLDAYVGSNPLLASVRGLSQGVDPVSVARFATAGFDTLGKLSHAYGQLGIGGGATGALGALGEGLNPLSGLMSGNPLSWGVNVSSFRSRDDWTASFGTALQAGGNITLAAGRDLNLLDGAQLAAGGDVALSAVNDITITAAEETRSSSSRSMSVGLTFTGYTPTGGSVSVSRSNSSGTRYTGASIAAGGDITIISGGDTTVRGGTISAGASDADPHPRGPTGGTLTADVGGDLTVESVQDTSTSRSSSFGASFNATGGASLNAASSRANETWTNTLAQLRARQGLAVTVGGTTSLIGGGLYATEGERTLSTGALVVRDLIDSSTSRSSSFGVSGIGGTQGIGGALFAGASDAHSASAPSASAPAPEQTQGSSAYTSPFKGSVSLGQERARREGVTYSVIGPGQITLTDPGADESAVATVRRDPAGRQVVTVDSSSGFKVEIPLVDFDQLGREATNIGNFLSAITSPVPADVAAQGPAAETIFRRMIANGMSADDATRVSQSPSFAVVARHYDAAARAVAEGRDLGVLEMALLAQGETLLYGDASAYPGGAVQVPCTTGSTCQVALDKFAELIGDEGKRALILAALEKGVDAVRQLEGGAGAYDAMVASYHTLLKCAVDEPEVFNTFLAQHGAHYLEIGARLGFSQSTLEDIQFAAAGYLSSKEPTEDAKRRKLVKEVWNASFSTDEMQRIGLSAAMVEAAGNVKDMVELAEKLSTPEERAKLKAQLGAAWDLVTSDPGRFAAIVGTEVKKEFEKLKVFLEAGNDADVTQWLTAAVIGGAGIKKAALGTTGTLGKIAWEVFDDIPGYSDDALRKLANDNPAAYIDLVRKKHGMPEINGKDLGHTDPGGTIAMIDLGVGKPVSGVNSSALKGSIDAAGQAAWEANKDLGQKWFK
ncbi:MAG: hemagglutinin repeat-containing protein, partial [Hyphomicrobium sp.]